MFIIIIWDFIVPVASVAVVVVTLLLLLGFILLPVVNIFTVTNVHACRISDVLWNASNDTTLCGGPHVDVSDKRDSSR